MSSKSRKRPLTQTTLDNTVIHEKRAKPAKVNRDIPTTTNVIKKRAGTIVRVVLKNFMCHSHLEVNLENNINYIIGRNGSGKSAILTALVVGLGGKASITNRGTSIKSFVKAGKPSATIEIVLHNVGCESYKQSTYGRQIIIQRHFTASGGSSYRIKSASGLLISTSCKELHQILSNLNIQIDNPICVLNQDTSRNFLSTSDSKQKFILFMRATRLELLFEKYKNAIDNRKECKRVYKEKEEVHVQLKNQLMELRKKIEYLQNVSNLKLHIKQLEKELLWAKVSDAENDRNTCLEVVEQHQKKYDEYEDGSRNRNQRSAEIKDRLSELHQQISELKEASAEKSQPHLDIENEISALKQTFSEKRRARLLINKQMEDKNRNIDVLNQEIKNFTANLSKIEQEKLAKKSEITALQGKMKSIDDMNETTQNDVFQMRSNIRRQEERENDLHRESKEIRARQENLIEQIKTLTSESSNNLLLYGRDMPTIIAEINKNKRKFTQGPRGPLGSYVSIKDKKWSVAIEGFLGTGLLQSFAVDNKNDNIILMDIFNKHWRSGRKPTIITSKFFNKVHDVRRNLVQGDEDCISLYDAIDVKDPVVMNCLIDQMAIESILLVPSTDRAIQLLSNQARVPKNCRQGVTIKGDKYYPDPNYKTYASRYHQARFLQVDTAELISGYQESLDGLKKNLKGIQVQINAVVLEKDKQKQELSQFTNKLEKLKQASAIAKRKIDELRLTDDPESIDVQSLENEATELKAVMQQLNVNAQKVNEEMQTIKEHIADGEERLKVVASAIKSYEDRIVPLQEQLMEETRKSRELSVNTTFDKKRLQDVKNKLELARSEMLRKEETVTGLIQEATDVCERLEDTRNVPEIMSEMTIVQTDIRKAETSMEDPDDVTRKFQETSERCQQVNDIMTKLQENIIDLHTAIGKRSKHYKTSEDYYINYINHNFIRVLEYRQFKGRIDVNVREKKLDLVVIPHQGSQGHTITANLSGGERSFSTVAFLYALWQCMEFPFYFLDEFDVFMDKINRSKVMEILIHHAKSRPRIQFVFLTPQDVSFIQDDDVSIHRLEDPERRAVPEL